MLNTRKQGNHPDCISFRHTDRVNSEVEHPRTNKRTRKSMVCPNNTNTLIVFTFLPSTYDRTRSIMFTSGALFNLHFVLKCATGLNNFSLILWREEHKMKVVNYTRAFILFRVGLWQILNFDVISQNMRFSFHTDFAIKTNFGHKKIENFFTRHSSTNWNFSEY